MKKTLKLFLILYMSIFLVSCSNGDNLSLKNYRERPIDFNIDKITLSKGFQNIDPEVTPSDKNNSIRLFLSLGIVDCSEINIKEITIKNNDINIYIEKTSDEDSNLSVPQLIVYLEDEDLPNYKDLNFNIVNENYEPILLKFNKSDIIKKVSTDFNIAPINLPMANLYKKDNQILWDIDFYSVINNNSPTKELINLFTIVDADSGKVLESMNDTISTRLFDGELLDYMPESNLLIKNNYFKNEIEYTDLYTYNEVSNEKNILFSTKGDILSALLSNDGKYIAFIESLDDSTNLYTISTETKLATKVNPLDTVNPKLIKWSKGNNLYILDNDNDNSQIHLYNISDNTRKSIYKGDFPLCDFDINGDKLLLTKSSEDINKDIYYQDKEIKLTKVSFGRKAEFLNDDTVVLIEGSESSDENRLLKYSISEDSETTISNQNIRNFQIQNEDNIIYSSKDSKFNNYLVNRYNIVEDKSRPIFHMIDDNIFINYQKEYIYISLAPTENVNDKYIYKVFLDKLNIK